MEWVIWKAKPGRLPLFDGRFVHVSFGDEVLMEEAEDGIRFYEHKPKVLH